MNEEEQEKRMNDLMNKLKNLKHNIEVMGVLQKTEDEFHEREDERNIEWEEIFYNKHPEPTMEAIRELFEEWLNVLEYDIKKEKEYYAELSHILQNHLEININEVVRLSALILLHKYSGLSNTYIAMIQFGTKVLISHKYKDYSADLTSKDLIEKIFENKSEKEPPEDLKDFFKNIKWRGTE